MTGTPAADTPARGLPAELAAALDRLDALVGGFEEHPDEAVREQVVELLRCVDTLHRTGLRRLAGAVEPGALADPAVRLLLDLYELGEDGERARADAVLDTVRPYVESHGGRLEVVAARDGVVTVRLAGACSGCAGSAATLRQVVEQALRDELVDFRRMEVAEPPPRPPSNFVPLSSLVPEERPRLTWYAVGDASAVPEGTLRAAEVDGERVLVARIAGELYAYRNACPGTPFPLDAAPVEEGVLRCPWHGCRFDLRGGRRVDAPGPGLGVVPISVESGRVRIGVLAGAA